MWRTQRPHRGREPVRVPAQLVRSGAASRERRAQRAFPDTPPGSLKGPGSPGLSPFPRSPSARIIASQSAPARLLLRPWSCPLLLAGEDREGFTGAGASPISWKGSVTLRATLAVCSPGLFRSSRLGQLLLQHLPRK